MPWKSALLKTAEVLYPDKVQPDEFKSTVAYMNSMGWRKTGYADFYHPRRPEIAVRIYPDGWTVANDYYPDDKGSGDSLDELKAYLAKIGLGKPIPRPGRTIDVQPNAMRRLTGSQNGYDFTNKGWLTPDGVFEGWSNTNISHCDMATELFGFGDHPKALFPNNSPDDVAADEGYIAVSNDGVNVMFTFKRWDRNTIEVLRGAMENGKFPARPLITLTNSGFPGKQVMKEFDRPEQAADWLSNL
jgi:hypothetical protein